MLKKTAIVAAIIIGAIIILAIVLKLVINPENYRGQIVSQAEKALNGRKVDIGKIELKLFPTVGLKIKSLTVGNLGEFSEDGESFVDVNEAEIRVGLLSLLTDTIKIKKVELKQPRIYVGRNEEGVMSIDDLLNPSDDAGDESAPEEPATGDEAGQGKKFLVESISISGGQLAFDDMHTPTGEYKSIQIEQLDAIVKDLALDRPIGLDIAAAIESETQEQNFFIKGTVGPLGEDLDFKETAADASLKFKDFKIGFLQPYYDEYVPVEIASGLLEMDLRVSGRLDDVLNTEGVLGFRDFGYIDKEHTWQPTPKFDLILDQKGLFKMGDTSFTLEKGTLKIGEMDLSLSGSGAYSEELLKYKVEASDGEFDLGALLPLLGPLNEAIEDMGIELTGGSGLLLKADSDGKAIAADIDLDLGQAKLVYPDILRKVPGEDCSLKTRIKLTEDAYNIELISAKITLLDLSGSGSIGTAEGMPANINFKTNKVPLRKFKSNLLLIKDYGLDGDLELEGKISGSIENTDRLTISLSKADFKSSHSDVKIAGSITGFTAPVLKFDINSNNMDLDKILEGMSEEEAESGAGEKAESAPATAEEEESMLAKASGSGKIRIGKAIYSKETISNIKAGLSIKNGVFKSSDLGMNMAGGSLSIPLVLDLSGKEIAYELEPSFKNIDMNRLLSAFTDMDNMIYGTGNGSIKLEGMGTEWEMASKKLKGSGGITLKDGSIKNVDLLGSLLNDWIKSDDLVKLSRFALGDKAFERNQETKFKSLDTKFNVAKAEVDFKKLEIDHRDGVFDLTGTVGLDYETDLSGRVTFNQQISRDLARQGGIATDVPGLFDCDGRLVLAMRGKGKFPDDVRISLDSKEYGRIIRENLKCGLGEEIKDEAEKIIKDEAEKLLKDIFNP